MVLCVVTMCCVSCKSKQSAYKAAYEQAKEREMTNSEPVEEQITPVTKAKTSTATRQEKITPISGENPEGIKLYSVVIGSFKNKTNAYSLKERMQNEGYMPVLGENEQGHSDQPRDTQGGREEPRRHTGEVLPQLSRRVAAGTHLLIDHPL